MTTPMPSRCSGRASIVLTGDEAKFNAVQSEKLNLKALALDGTGTGSMLVKQQVETLRNAVDTHVGTRHEPLTVQVVWGSLLFYGRVESLKFDDTLPLLCERIYRAPCLAVARVNGLTSLRQLEPGMRLRFPPLA